MTKGVSLTRSSPRKEFKIKILREKIVSTTPEEWTEEQLVVMVFECESVVFNVAWKDSEHLGELVSALSECRRELSLRGYAHRAI